VNLQRENTSESEVFEQLAEMNPLLGNPLTFYEEFVMKYNESYQNAARAQSKVVKEAATLFVRTLMELTNKRKCHELNSSRPHVTNSQKLGTHYPEPETASKSSSTKYYSWELCLRETGLVARNVLVRSHRLLPAPHVVNIRIGEPKK
jgi:hypothetical protein